MKIINNKRFPLLAGLAIIIATNVIALAGVAYNRSGEPEAVIELTERELAMPSRYGFSEENSGLQLRLRWRTDNETPTRGYSYGSHDLAWLTKEKLAEIGFDTTVSLDDETSRRHYEKMLPREAYLVLEYDGASHQAAIKHQQNKLAEEQAVLANDPVNKRFENAVKTAQKTLEAEMHTNSRLFVIDAGLDKSALRTRYADKSKYIIMQGEIALRVNHEVNGLGYTLNGYIKGTNINSVNVAHEHHALFKELTNNQGSGRYQQAQEPRYAVRLAIGKRGEPWLMAVRPLDADS